jgi:predicted SAM-dependent methyltransferase
MNKLFFGCGNLDMRNDGYKNVDIRPMPHVDYVCDISKRLPFQDDWADEIFAESVLEHIPHGFWNSPASYSRAHLNTIAVLKEWCRVLKSGGKCIVKVPNVRGLVSQYMRNNILPRDFWMYIYGGQEYKENTHLSGFDPATLTEVMLLAGFKDVIIRNAHDLEQLLAEDDAWEMAGVGTK